jgi:hypothetical protein
MKTTNEASADPAVHSEHLQNKLAGIRTAFKPYDQHEEKAWKN